MKFAPLPEMEIIYDIAVSHGEQLSPLGKDDHAGRIAVLIQDIEWAKGMSATVIALERSWSQAASRWIPTLMTLMEGAETAELRQITETIYKLGRMHDGIIDVFTEEAPLARLTDRWEHTFAMLVVEHERWLRLAVMGEVAEESGGRAFVRPDLLDALFADQSGEPSRRYRCAVAR
jgi:hypothetical protein